MKRWIGALVAAVFFATAAFHGVSHVGQADSACVVCHVQGAGVLASTPPIIVAAAIVSTDVAAVELRTSAAVVFPIREARAPPTARV